MPKLSRWAVRVSLVYFGLGITIGALMLANEGLSFAAAIWGLLPAHIELMVFGWMTQFAMGVAFWILPRFPGNAPRGNERWSWAGFWLFNLGILAAAGASLPAFGQAALVGHVLEAVGLAAFMKGNWRRVYPFAGK